MKKLIVILILLLLALGAAVWSLKFSGVTHEDIYEAVAEESQEDMVDMAVPTHHLRAK